MDQDMNSKQSPLSSGKKRFLWSLSTFAWFLLILLILTSFTACAEVNPNVASWFTAATPTTAIPTPACVRPMLMVGSTSFPIQSMQRAADGSVNIPAQPADTAYWVEGTNSTFVFGLSPVPSVLPVKDTLKEGDPIKIVWADCSEEDYVFKAVEAGQPDAAALFDQSAPGIRVFVPKSTSTVGFVIQGVRPQAQSAGPTETPEPGAVQAEVEFLDTSVSQDGKTLNVSIAITNKGSTPIQLAMDNISLVAEGEALYAPLSVDPALPQEIGPGKKATFKVVFNKPNAKTAVFRLLDFSVDLYY